MPRSARLKPMEISCGVPPSPQAAQLAVQAEKLGYDRVWLYDSPAIYEDIWAWLALCAQATSKIGLGTAVLVPHSRHVMVTASAAATIEGLAPGRLTLGFGTGASARWFFAKNPLSWDYLITYIQQLRGLLRGEVVTIEGEQCQMMHFKNITAKRPIEIPILLSAMGPKGQKLTEEHADGIFTIGGGQFDLDWHVQMVNGTVLDDGETLESDRVKQAVGPWYVLMYHAGYYHAPDSVNDLPAGPQWREALEAERPADERHLIVHEGHVTELTERDQILVDNAGDMLGAMGWVGSAAEIKDKVQAAADAGVTEILYTPAGPDLARELEAFAQVAIG